jgi:hypothetical protein
MPKQIILIMGAILLISFISLRMNQTVSDGMDSTLENEAILTATEHAQSVLREVAAEKFDERAIDSTITNPANMTPLASLGPDFGEAYPLLDDIDDFKGFVATNLTSDRLGSFTHKVSVWYTAPGGGVSGTPTLYKEVEVRVYNNPFLKDPVTGRPDTVVLSTVVSY